MHEPDSRVPAITAILVILAVVVVGGAVVALGVKDLKKDEPITATPLEKTEPPPFKAELEKYYTQKLKWRSCRSGDKCATLVVPLDYAEPDGETIQLSVLKVPALSPERRIGALVVNPGGPGGSGVDYAAAADSYFGTQVRQTFDIVGFDPRGVGESTPLDCLGDKAMDEYVASDPDPDTTAEVAAGDRLLREFGQGCLKRSGSLAEHMSTEEVVRDVDVLRAALKQNRLMYFGASYGTYIGATYADLFPANVGRMVLDGAIDPSLSTLEMSRVQGKGFETALRAYVGKCVDDGGCYLGANVDDGTARIRRFLDEVDASPIPGDGERELTEGLAVLGIWTPLYNKDYWSLLDNALEAALQGNGAGLLALADAYVSRGPDGYLDNSLEALFAVNCLDHDDAVPVERIPVHEADFLKASPTFGRIFAFGLSACDSWPVHTGKRPAKIHANGAAPILVVGTTRDPATPLSWAEALAEQLQSGVLVRRDGDGHTGYFADNGCVDFTVESYLVAGEVPDQTVDC